MKGRAVMVFATLAVAASACAGSRPYEVRETKLKATVARSGPAAAAVAYVRAAAAGGAVPATAPANARQGRSLAALRRWFRLVPVEKLAVTAATTTSPVAADTAVLVTIRARLGDPPGTTWVSLGERILLVRRWAGSWRVAGDASGGRIAVDRGLSAVPGAGYSVTAGGVIVNAAGLTDGEVTHAMQVVVRQYPRLARLYARGAARPPLVLFLPTRRVSSQVAGTSLPW